LQKRLQTIGLHSFQRVKKKFWTALSPLFLGVFKKAVRGGDFWGDFFDILRVCVRFNKEFEENSGLRGRRSPCQMTGPGIIRIEPDFLGIRRM